MVKVNGYTKKDGTKVKGYTRKRPKTYPQTGTSNKAKDRQLPAKKPGWRKPKQGKKYFENRRNRSDKSKKRRL